MVACFPAEILVLTVTNPVIQLRSLLKDHLDLLSSVVKYCYRVIPLGNHFECGAGMQCVILKTSHKKENLYLTCLLKKKNINVFE